MILKPCWIGLASSALIAACLILVGCEAKSDASKSKAGQSTASRNSNNDRSDSASANGVIPTVAGEGITSGKRDGLPEVIKSGKVEFRVGEGEELFSFKPKDEGTACKFYNATGQEVCKLTFVDGILKAKTPDDMPLFELKPKDDKLMIKDATGDNELFKFKFRGDTIDFYQPNDVRVYRIKRQDYGWRLEDNHDQTLFRAKSHNGKMVLRDLNDKTVLYSNDIPSPLGLIFFRMDGLSLEQQAACCVMFLDR